MLEQQLGAALAIAKPDRAMKQKIVTIKCRLWVLKGSLERGFNYKLLMEISDKYEKIGMVPTGYTYPLLFQ